MTFENHIWLYLAPLTLLVMVGIALLGLRRKDRLINRFVADRLAGQLIERGSPKRSLIKAGCIALSAACIALAMARPQFGVEWTEQQAKGLDIVFILDTSKSMLATDLRPSRLDRAKLAIRDIIDKLESDRIGLVAFAGNAFLQTPPTLDYAAFRESLDSISPDIMTRGGSELGRALTEAANAFPQENNFKVCILLTDGEDLGGGALEAAEAIAKDGIQVHAIGIGTPEGDYLRIRETNGEEVFVRDAEGHPVRSQLDEGTLQQIAQITGGSYFRLSNQSLSQLYTSVLSILPRQELKSEMQEIHIERFQWFIGTALFLSILEFLIRRRRVSASALLILFTCLTVQPQEMKAQSAPELTEVPALELPNDSRAIYNLGHSQIQTGDFNAAAESFGAAVQATNDLKLQADALYNQAHATYQMGEAAFKAQDIESALEHWKAAESLFSSANEINPGDTEAQESANLVKARREALEKFIQEQTPPENPEQNDSSDSGESGDQDSKQQDQQSDSQEQNGDGGESEQNQNGQSQSGEQNSEQSPSESDRNGEESKGGSEENAASSEEDSEDQSPGESDNSEADGNEQGETKSANEGDESQSGSKPESSANPLDDIPEESSGTSGQGAESSSLEEGENPGVTTSAATGAESGGSTETMEQISLREARALLDSMRESERLLPFAPNSDGSKRETRDW